MDASQYCKAVAVQNDASYRNPTRVASLQVSATEMANR